MAFFKSLRTRGLHRHDGPPEWSRPGGFLLLLLVLLLAACGDRAGEYGERGKDAYRRGDFGAARDYLSVAIRAGLGERDPELRYVQALTLYRVNRPAQALKILETLHRDETFRVPSIQRRVEILLSLGRFEEAGEIVQAALAESPDDVDLLEASALVEDERFEAEWQTLEEWLAHLLGPRTGRFHARHLKEIIAKAASVVQTEFERETELMTRAGLTDVDGLRERFDAARKVLDGALALSRRVLESRPNAFSSLLFLGRMDALAGRNEQALERFQSVARMEADESWDLETRRRLPGARAEAVEGAIEILKEEERYEDAIAFFQEVGDALKSKSRRDHALAELCFLAGRVEELERIADRILEDESRDAFGCFYKGYALFTAGKSDAAIAYLERAQAESPGFALYNRYLGLALKNVGQNVRALKALERAMESGERDAEIAGVYAEILVKLGARWRALRFLGTMAAKMGGQPAEQRKLYETWVRLGGEEDPTLATLESARSQLEDHEKDLWLRLRLAQLELEADHVSRARSHARFVLAFYEDMPEALRVVVRCDLRWGQWERALEELDAYEKKSGESPPTLAMRARALAGLKRFDEARRLARKALNAQGDLLEAARILADIEVRSQSLEKAEKVVSTLLESFPRDEVILRSLVRLRMRLRMSEGCIPLLKTLCELQPEDARAAFDLGRNLQWVGRIEESLAPLEEAARLARGNAFLSLAIARYLLRAGSMKVAGELVEEALETLPPGKERREALTMAVRLRHEAGDPRGALRAALAVQRSGDARGVLEVFLPLAVEAGACLEASEMMKQALARGELGPRAARAGLAALVRLGRFQEALDLIPELVEKGEVQEELLTPERFRALLGAGRRTEAGKLFKRAIGRSEGAGRTLLARLWLRSLVDAGEAAAALQVLPWIRKRVPAGRELLYEAARAASRLERYDEALALLEAAPPASEEGERLEVARAALLLHAGRREEALEVAAGTEAASLVAFLAGAGCEAGTAGAWLTTLSKGKNPSEDGEGIGAPGGLPRVLRSLLDRLAEAVAAHPRSGPDLARAVGRLLLARRSGVLIGEALREVEAAGKPASEFRPLTSLMGVLVEAEAGAPAAAGALLGRLAEDARGTPQVLYSEALLHLRTRGAADMWAFLRSRAGGEPLDEEVSDDLIDLCRSRGLLGLAYDLIRLQGARTPEQVGLAARVAAELGNHDLAREYASRLPEAERDRPPACIILARAALGDPFKRREARDLLRTLFDEEVPAHVGPPLLLLQTAGEAGISSVYERLVDAALDAHPYDSHVIAEILSIARESGYSSEVIERIRLALTFLDPARKARFVPSVRRLLVDA